jgi:hypothetical protein
VPPRGSTDGKCIGPQRRTTSGITAALAPGTGSSGPHTQAKTPIVLCAASRTRRPCYVNACSPRLCARLSLLLLRRLLLLLLSVMLQPQRQRLNSRNGHARYDRATMALRSPLPKLRRLATDKTPLDLHWLRRPMVKLMASFGRIWRRHSTDCRRPSIWHRVILQSGGIRHHRGARSDSERGPLVGLLPVYADPPSPVTDCMAAD